MDHQHEQAAPVGPTVLSISGTVGGIWHSSIRKLLGKTAESLPTDIIPA